jgi:CDP-glucose 4,6-dehydratase
MKKVLITGGTGFLGAHMVRRLLTKKSLEYVVVPTTKIRDVTTIDKLQINSKKVKLIQGDIRDFDFIQRMFNEYEFDTVFHLAAMSEVRKCQSNPKLAFDTNINGTINILEACRVSKHVEAIVVSSSDKAYGSSPVPYKEGSSLDGRGVYEVSKSCTDIIARSYNYNYKLPVTVTRCSNLYGEGDLNYSRIIPNTIRLVTNGKQPLVWTGAENFVREFIYVEDAVDAYLALANDIVKAAGNSYNIGSGEKITVGNLVKMIMTLMSSNVGINYEHRTFPEISSQYLDSSRIKEDTGWSPKTKLDEGLKKAIEYYVGEEDE